MKSIVNLFSNHLTVPISISFNFLWGALFGFLPMMIVSAWAGSMWGRQILKMRVNKLRQLQHILHNFQLIQMIHLHQQFRKFCLFHLCLEKNYTGKHDCYSIYFQPSLRCHRTVDDHLFPLDQTCDAKGTRGEWWTCRVSQQNDSKWGEEMGIFPIDLILMSVFYIQSISRPILCLDAFSEQRT